MKSFGQFLSEAVKTAASAEAKLKGLVGDGHGGWYDKKGKFQAKTVQGKLKYVGAGGSADDEAPKEGGPAKIDKPKKPAAAAPAPAPTKSAPQQQQGVEAVSYTHLTLPTKRIV